jgi:hypothetical protein
LKELSESNEVGVDVAAEGIRTLKWRRANLRQDKSFPQLPHGHYLPTKEIHFRRFSLIAVNSVLG